MWVNAQARDRGEQQEKAAWERNSEPEENNNTASRKTQGATSKKRLRLQGDWAQANGKQSHNTLSAHVAITEISTITAGLTNPAIL